MSSFTRGPRWLVVALMVLTLGLASLPVVPAAAADCSARYAGADLSGCYLRNADLSGLDLSGADLRGANLAGADLTGTILTGADLRGANLRGATLSEGALDSANTEGANLRNITWIAEPTISVEFELHESGAFCRTEAALTNFPTGLTSIAFLTSDDANGADPVVLWSLDIMLKPSRAIVGVGDPAIQDYIQVTAGNVTTGWMRVEC